MQLHGHRPRYRDCYCNGERQRAVVLASPPPDRLLFGSNYLKPGQEVRQFELLAGFDLRAEFLAGIARGNAKRLLKLGYVVGREDRIASAGRSRPPGPPATAPPGVTRAHWLLNARRRHRLVHPDVAAQCSARRDVCSTPEGVIVWFTSTPRLELAAPRIVLNARRRHRLVHQATPRRLEALPCTAQRPKASSSGSPSGAVDSRSHDAVLLNARRRHRLVHAAAGASGRRPRTAQRPKASSSGSRAAIGDGRWMRRRAQRPKASSSGSRGVRRRRASRASSCSTPEGVIVWFTARRRGDRTAGDVCSTPEGVIVWFTSASVDAVGRLDDAAQRPKASSSGSRVRRCAEAARAIVCSTPEGVIVWFTRALGDRATAAPTTCSTPEGVIVWFTRSAMPRPRPSRRLLNARRRHRLVHTTSRASRSPTASMLLNARRRHRLVHAGRPRRRSRRSSVLNARRRHRLVHAGASASAGDRRTCSTPEGVIVWFTRRAIAERGRLRRLLNARRRHRLVHRPVASPCTVSPGGGHFQGPVPQAARAAHRDPMEAGRSPQPGSRTRIPEIHASPGLPTSRRALRDLSLASTGGGSPGRRPPMLESGPAAVQRMR